MRILFLCVFFLFLNCEDKQTKNKSTTINKESDSEKEEIIEESNNEETRKYPKLDDNNAMDFFLEYNEKHKENKVRIFTDFGTIDIQLFDDTKFHRSNFIFLTKQGYFNGTQFYRAIDNFIVQAGNSDDMKTSRKRAFIGKYLLPTDTNRGYT